MTQIQPTSKMNRQDKQILEAKAKVIKALAHPTRIWMTEQLAKGERCVCEFVDAMDVDFSTISKHLSILKQAGIVEDDKRGKQVFYQLKVPCILNFMSCVEAVIESQCKTQAALLK
jgi:ArsR family transcriptional regulator